MRRLDQRSRVVILAALLLALAAIAYVAFRGGTSVAAAASGVTATALAPVTTTRARVGSVARTLAAVGRIGSPGGGDAKLAFALTGIVDTVLVTPGERVVAGQAIATLDRRALAASLAQARDDATAAGATYAGGAGASAVLASARAKFAAAEARARALRAGGAIRTSARVAADATARQAAIKVDLDRAALERARGLFAGGVVARKDVDAANAQLLTDLADRATADAKRAAAGVDDASSARAASADALAARSDLVAAASGVGATAAQYASALARLAGAETDFARATLTAPSDGVIASVLKHPGEATDPSTPVVDLDPAVSDRITLAVPASDAAELRTGDAATVTLASGARSVATIDTIVPAVDPVTQNATVILRGNVPGGANGRAVSATIVVERVSGTIVPSSAVVTDPGTGASVVFERDRSSNEKPFVARRVDVRADDGTSAIVTGIRAGAEVATSGGYDLLAPSGS